MLSNNETAGFSALHRFTALKWDHKVSNNRTVPQPCSDALQSFL